MIILLIGAGFAAMLPLPAFLSSGAVSHRVCDALHLPMFAFVALALHPLLSPDINRRRRLLLTALISSSLAAAVELIQPCTGRNASWRDFGFGMIGIGLALWLLSRYRTAGAKQSICFAVTALAGLTVVTWPIWNAHGHAIQLREIFPHLIHARPQTNATFWHAQGGAELQFDNHGQIQVDTRSGEWSGIHFTPGGQDWSHYETLVLHLTGTAPQPFLLGLRIDDKASTDHSNRFHTYLELLSGGQVIRIALADVNAGATPLDLSRVVRMVLHTAPDDPPRCFTLERAFLE